MLYGTILGTAHGINIHIMGYPTVTYIGYSLREAKRRYRDEHGLKYRKIVWGGNMSCCA